MVKVVFRFCLVWGCEVFEGFKRVGEEVMGGWQVPFEVVIFIIYIHDSIFLR
jgi:hypothetical protein